MSASPAMPRKQLFSIIRLTLVYLLFELAFNARLLDVVGGTATQDQIHHIEIYGRSLSGAAVGLLVMQWLLGRRNASKNQSPSGMTILLAVAASGILTYGVLKVIVDTAVANSSASFRRASLNIVLVQRALVQGTVELDGLTDDAKLFAQPAGKAFLAQFPLMATSIDRLDEKIRNAKLTLITTQVSEALGQAGGFYNNQYVKAVKATQEKWQRYSKAPSAQDLDGEIAKQQDKAWSEYLNDLGRRGWTPSTVPGMARGAVLRKVRSRVPVPSNWDLADEATFRDAVAAKVRKRAGAATGGPKGLTVHGQRLAPGLGWNAFFTHPGVQAELRDQLHLPAGVSLQSAYSSGAEFQREVFDPMVKRLAQDELTRYDAPVDDFANGGKLAERGLDAARLALVPPLALLFSLLGAMTHLGKLCYLGVKGVLGWKPHWGERITHVWPVLIGVVAMIWITLSWTENAVTQSRLYDYMRQQMRDSAQPTVTSQAWKWLQTNGLHVVAVGQDLGYPLFEGIRTQVLGGITYGYEESHH